MHTLKILTFAVACLLKLLTDIAPLNVSHCFAIWTEENISVCSLILSLNFAP
jgi:hypothetical protein